MGYAAGAVVNLIYLSLLVALFYLIRQYYSCPVAAALRRSVFVVQGEQGLKSCLSCLKIIPAFPVERSRRAAGPFS